MLSFKLLLSEKGVVLSAPLWLCLDCAKTNK